MIVRPLNTLHKDPCFLLLLLLGPLVTVLLGVALDRLHAPQFDLAMLVLPVVVYPVLEEMAFRGFIQEWLLQRSKKQLILGVSVANMITTSLFVAAHLVYQPLFWALLVAIPSLVFGWARDRYNSVIPSIILHAFYNVGFFMLMA